MRVRREGDGLSPLKGKARALLEAECVEKKAPIFLPANENVGVSFPVTQDRKMHFGRIKALKRIGQVGTLLLYVRNDPHSLKSARRLRVN